MTKCPKHKIKCNVRENFPFGRNSTKIKIYYCPVCKEIYMPVKEGRRKVKVFISNPRRRKK